MNQHFIAEKSIDDLMRVALEIIRDSGHVTIATKGAMKELVAVHLVLSNPRARLSRTETRGKAFSCLGELFWYLSGSDELDFISYYIPKYREFSDGGRLLGAYGPRLINWDGVNQLDRIIELLAMKRSSRQAAIQVFDKQDLQIQKKDIPCTCTFQFMIRSDRLNMITYMRSNDAFLGLPHDIFCFSMIQEIIAISLGVELGDYHHMVGSLHIYDEHKKQCQQFLKEGWQSYSQIMPRMPNENPRLILPRLLEIEASIRVGEEINAAEFGSIPPYWADLLRLLLVFRYFREEDASSIMKVRSDFQSPVYLSFIDGKLEKLT